MKKILFPLFISVLLAACTTAAPEPQQPVSPSPTPTTPVNAVPADFPLLSGIHTVVIKTTKGDMTLELDADAAPKTVTNFITHARNGYYDDLDFHRVIKKFMIQGGDPSGNGTGGESIWGDSFEDEINANSYGLQETSLQEVSEEKLPAEIKDMTLKAYLEQQGYEFNEDLDSLPMVRGSIAMANRGPNTNGSQFFIVHADETPWLEGKHTVFGQVTEGMDVLDTIATTPTGAGGKPLEPISFTVEIVE